MAKKVKVVRKRTGAAEQAANAKYNPAIRDLNRQITQSRGYQRQIPSFYDAYRQDIQAAQTANDARATQQAQASEANRAAISAQENADYKRVHGIDKPVGADQESQAAAQSRQVAAGVVSGILSAQRTNTYNSQLNSQNQERAKRSELRSKRAEIKGEKKQYQREVRTKIRSDAAAAQAKQAALALQQWKAQVAAQQANARLAQGEERLKLSAQQNRANRRLARARIRVTKRGQNLSNARANQPAAAKPPSSSDVFNANVSKAINIVASFGPQGRKNWVSKNPQGLVANLVRRGIPGAAAQEAVKRLRGIGV